MLLWSRENFVSFELSLIGFLSYVLHSILLITMKSPPLSGRFMTILLLFFKLSNAVNSSFVRGLGILSGLWRIPKHLSSVFFHVFNQWKPCFIDLRSQMNLNAHMRKRWQSQKNNFSKGQDYVWVNTEKLFSFSQTKALWSLWSHTYTLSVKVRIFYSN